MIYHNMDEYQNYLFDQLWNRQFGGLAKVTVREFLGSYAISFHAKKNYFGTIYPMRCLLKIRAFRKQFDADELVKYFRCGNRFFNNYDVCPSCRKLKFYPNVYLLTMQCDLEDLLNPWGSKSGKELYFVFCKHHDILVFLEYDYFTEDEEDSSFDDGEYLKET